MDKHRCYSYIGDEIKALEALKDKLKNQIKKQHALKQA